VKYRLVLPSVRVQEGSRSDHAITSIFVMCHYCAVAPHMGFALLRTTTHKDNALFSSEKISNFGTVALSFVCDKYYLIMD